MTSEQEKNLIKKWMDVERENKKLKQRIAMDKHLRKTLYSMLTKSLSKEFISSVEAASYRMMMDGKQQENAEIIREYFEELSKEVTEG